jgi:hypothetical protein
MNVTRACARAPSLRHFLTGLGTLLDSPQIPVTVSESVPRNLSREVFAGLIREVMPATTTVWRTSEGYSFTAKQLLEEIENGSEIGRQYAADLLRVARDFLKRQALRGETP